MLAHRLSAVMAVLLLVGCDLSDHWKPVELTPQTLGENGALRAGRARIWSHGKHFDWESVVITADSVTGIPDRASCSWCRHRLARADVDSVFISNNPNQEIAGLLVLVGGLSLWAIVFHGR